MRIRPLIIVSVIIATLLLAACGPKDDGGGPVDPGAGACALMITEVMADPVDPVKTGWEWIELYNGSGQDMDLSMLRIVVREGSGSPDYLSFRPDVEVLIPAGEYFLLRQSAGEEEHPDPDDPLVYWYEKGFRLPQSDFTVAVRSLDGTLYHQLSFGLDAECVPATGVLPAIPPGASMELQPGYAGDCDRSFIEHCEAWDVAWQKAIPGSLDKGTPGAAPAPKPVGDAPVQGELVVTEIQSASGDDCGADWFELLNLTDRALSLEGCLIADSLDNGGAVVDAPAVIPAGGYAVFADMAMGDLEIAYLFTKPDLNKTGDVLSIRCPDAAGDLQDVLWVEYGGGEGTLPKPVEPASIGVCFDLLPADPAPADYLDPAFWAVTEKGTAGCGSDIGSPGLQNVSCVCEPDCAPGICDVDDGCGGSCGCGENGVCVEGACECEVAPDCTNKACGDDGCGGSCGACEDGQGCVTSEGFAACAATPQAPGDLVPVELMSDASDACGGVDWFELKNRTATDLVLEGCVIGDAAATGTHTIAAPLIVPAGGLALLAGGEIDGVDVDYVFTKPNLNKDADTLFLRCTAGEAEVTIFEVTYGAAEGDLPAPEEGRSAGLCPDLLPAEPTAEDYLDPANWTLTLFGAAACGDQGTPGAENIDCACEAACEPGVCDVGDGCGGVCGCAATEACVEGACVCLVEPDCTDKACGDDGCGGSCGACDPGLACVASGAGTLCAATPGPLGVIPTEIHTNAAAEICQGIDWFELYNPGEIPVTLNGCTVGDASASGSHTFDGDLVIPALGYLLVASAEMPGISAGYLTSKPNLNQGGDSLYLECPADPAPVMVFEIVFGGEGALPAPAEGASVGLCWERLPGEAAAADLLDPAFWDLTIEGADGCGGDLGSPGFANAPCQCLPSCAPDTCGDDGCGGACACTQEWQICAEGLCVCAVEPSCDGKECGDDGCGGSCGSCAGGGICVEQDGGSLCAFHPAPAQVVPTEISSHNTGDCAVDWFEVKNLGEVPVTLEGCTIGDASATGDHVISLPVVIPAGGLALFVAGGALPGAAADYDFPKPNLNQGGDTLWMECPGDPAPVPQFSVDFTGGMGALPAPAAGASVGLCLDLLPDAPAAVDYLAPANWTLTTFGDMDCPGNLGTPGTENIGCACELTCEEGACGVPDGCGGTCQCAGEGLLCDPNHQCVEPLDCAGLAFCVADCGDDLACWSAACYDLADPDAQGWFDAVSACLLVECGDLSDMDCVDAAFLGACAPVFAQCCLPDCGDSECGDDGCGGSCGACQAPLDLCQEGICVCPVTASCEGKECGDDGCGGDCGVCGEGESCVVGEDANLCAAPPAAGQVVPTEIAVFHGDTDCSGVDWFELMNLSGTHVDLAGCTIGDAVASGTHVLASPFVIPAGGLALLSSAELPGFTSDYIFPKPNLNQGGDLLWLECPGDPEPLLVFTVDFTGVEGGLPATPALASIAVCPDLLPVGAVAADYLAPANWAVSATGEIPTCADTVTAAPALGTPGTANPSCL